MHYTVEIDTSDVDGKSVLARDAHIVGRPDVYLHFAHHTFDIVWNEETGRQESVSKPKFYGGMGEGSSFDSWQDAIHVSLYDMYQCYEGFEDGDTFAITYQGTTQHYRAQGVHIIPVG